MSSTDCRQGSNSGYAQRGLQLPDGTDSKGSKNTRRGHRKTRLGCGTCKIRRVKCDEAKPSCRRCRDFGVECNGYAHLPRPPHPHTPRRPVLVPKQYSRIPAPTDVHTGPRFTDQREARCFHYYCTEIGNKIADHCRSPIWDRIIPQAGENEDFIAHAVAALGALSLSRAMSKTSLSSNQVMFSAAKSGPHYQFALTQYCKSLKSMREGLQEKLWGRTRTTLIASLVIFCIESLLGNVDSASIHASRSIGLLYMWRHQHAISDKHLCAQDAFEEDLYPAFPGLDLQALLHLDDRPQSVHLDFKNYLDYASEGHTMILTTPRTCVNACQLLLRRNLHFIAAWRMLDEYPEIPSASDDPAAKGKTLWSVALGPIQIPSSKRVEQRYYLEHIRLYTTCLKDFLDASASNKSEYCTVFYVATICKIHTAMNKILMTGSCFPPRTSWDSLLPDFREIVTLCKKIYAQATSRGGSTFGFDMGLIVPLSVTAIRCRDLGLRKEAIELLLSRPGYREGIWDAEAMGHVCGWILEIEGQDREELSYLAGRIEGEGLLVKEEPIAEKKATLLMVHFELDEKRVRPFCTVGGVGEDKEMVLRDKVISW